MQNYKAEEREMPGEPFANCTVNIPGMGIHHFMELFNIQ